MELEEILKRDTEFRYMLLNRMQIDCARYMDSGRDRDYLWAKEEYKHIAYMKAIWDSLSEKPKWLTKDQMERLEQELTPWLGDTPREEIEQLGVMYVGKLVFYDDKGFERTPTSVWFGCQIYDSTMGGEAFIHYDNALRPVFVDYGNFRKRLVRPKLRNVSAKYDGGCQLMWFYRE